MVVLLTQSNGSAVCPKSLGIMMSLKSQPELVQALSSPSLSTDHSVPKCPPSCRLHSAPSVLRMI
ncbi:hypothetical protein BDV25DRAFT_147646 [Aspergillus avenaceus]|uniref:Uncharacterized protein n=1 Tax=Aspergillus avenaceus TaxID=36643 RepID=A0A5N6U747_ASPAV|nr:hypothetical protein BDV25DRAFT_147646 [Aspergillus avenaceus]